MKKALYLIPMVVIMVAISLVLFTGAFTDVPEDAYYADAAERMAERGILSGFGDGRFYSEWELTRAQFAALACKMLGKVDEAASLAGKTDFVDVPETHWSTGYVNYAVANKIIVGYGDGNFRPDDSVKYEEAIKVIICVIDPDNDIEVDPTDWSKNYLEEAEKLGLTNNLSGKKGEALKRSDIAVLADNGMAIIDAAAVETTTTKKPSSQAHVTAETTTVEEPTPQEPAVTTTTPDSSPIIVTLPPIDTRETEDIGTEEYTRREDELVEV